MDDKLILLTGVAHERLLLFIILLLETLEEVIIGVFKGTVGRGPLLGGTAG